MKTYDFIINADKVEKFVCLTFFDTAEDSNDALEVRVPLSLYSAEILRDQLIRVTENLRKNA